MTGTWVSEGNRGGLLLVAIPVEDIHSKKEEEGEEKKGGFLFEEEELLLLMGWEQRQNEFFVCRCSPNLTQFLMKEIPFDFPFDYFPFFFWELGEIQKKNQKDFSPLEKGRRKKKQKEKVARHSELFSKSQKGSPQ